VDFGWDRIVDYVNAGAVGVRVTLTPYIGLESAELDVDIAVSDINGYSPQGAPILNTRYLYAYDRLIDNVPYIVGGIKRKEEIKSTAKIPLLGDLPILGWLAGGEQDSATETEIVVVITPKFMLGTESVLETPKEAQLVMDQVEGKEKLPIPINPFGFDQWLLDKEKKL
jgi:type II secretory pathway component GspD/PulD (secretin)